MTIKEANNLIEAASILIFQIEKALPIDDGIRKMGYQVRCELNNLYNALKETRDSNYIHEILSEDPDY